LNTLGENEYAAFVKIIIDVFAELDFAC